jgi:hypothetical protein
VGGSREARVGGRRRLVLLSASTIAVAVVGTFALGVSLAGSATTTNRASTRAYLLAKYVLAKEAAANAETALGTFERVAKSLESECPGVLAAAPPEPQPGTSFAQRVGESRRQEEQLSELESELSSSAYLIITQTDRQAIVAFAKALRSLHWTSRAIAEQVAEEAEAARDDEEVANRSIPSVCADMRFWVASGYKTLSPATKELRLREEPAARPRPRRATRPLVLLLRRYEGAAERLLIARTQKLNEARLRTFKAIDNVESQVAATLGIAHETESSFAHHRPGSVVIGKGKTAAGGNYEVLLEPKEPPPVARRRGAIGCAPDRPLNVNIISSEGDGISGCYSSSESSAPADASCTEGVWTIDARTLPAATAVRLTLSDGHKITSRPAIVPPQLGGPLGLYYQVVRGPTVPASLAELDARGKVIRFSKLHAFAGCTKHLLKFLPGGIRPLVRGRVPGGPSFTIKGEAYRFVGHIKFALSVDINNGGGGGESLSGKRPSVFSWATFRGCQPHAYVILYGLLKDPADSVSARTAGTVQPLRRAAIPAHLHAGGALVYLAASTAPDELLVRDRSGRTVISESLSELAKEAIETCQAETEGTTPGTIRG